MDEKRTKFTPVFRLLEEAKKRLKRYKYRILVMSGKGGVGKSLISAILAIALAQKGKRVALFDADIYGSSIPILLGLRDQRHYANEQGEILPVEGPFGIQVVAINLMLDSPDIPVAWRGPLAGRAIIELAAKVAWGSGDYLLIDMPPGTGDIPLTIIQVFPDITGAIIVTSPNSLSETIVAKATNFATTAGIKLLGIIENMSYFKCPHCGKISYIMGNYTGERLASKYGTVLLGKVPLDPAINEYSDKGVSYLLGNSEEDLSKAILAIVDKIINLVENSR